MLPLTLLSKSNLFSPSFSKSTSNTKINLFHTSILSKRVSSLYRTVDLSCRIQTRSISDKTKKKGVEAIKKITEKLDTAKSKIHEPSLLKKPPELVTINERLDQVKEDSEFQQHLRKCSYYIGGSLIVVCGVATVGSSIPLFMSVKGFVGSLGVAFASVLGISFTKQNTVSRSIFSATFYASVGLMIPAVVGLAEIFVPKASVIGSAIIANTVISVLSFAHSNPTGNMYRYGMFVSSTLYGLITSISLAFVLGIPHAELFEFIGWFMAPITILSAFAHASSREILASYVNDKKDPGYSAINFYLMVGEIGAEFLVGVFEVILEVLGGIASLLS